MDRYPRVLVGTDGSPDAVAAVQLSARIAARSGAPLVVVHIGEDDARDRHSASTAGADGTATLVLDEVREITDAAGVEQLETRTVEGKAPDVLLTLANEEPEQLVVVGSAGLSKASSRLVGSTSNRLTHHSLADVLFAKAPLPSTWNFVGLSTDGSPTSLHAVRHGLRAALALDATPRLITAAKTQEAGDAILRTALARLTSEGIDELATEVLIDPQPASAIAHAGWKYELVVIGNRGMSGPSRLLGSVANKITHELRTNLLLVNTTRT